MAIDVVGTLGALGVLGVLGGAIVIALLTQRAALRASIPTAFVWAIASASGAALGLLSPLTASLVFAGGLLLTIGVARGLLVIAPGWTGAVAMTAHAALVAVPLAFGVLSATPWLLLDLGVIDFGGGLAFAVPVLGTLVARAMLGRAPLAADGTARSWLVGIAVWVSVIAWLCGLEFAPGEGMIAVIVTAVLTPLLAAAGWLVVELILTGRGSLLGASRGLIAGAVASIPAAAQLDVLWSVVLGATVGSAASAVALSSAANRPTVLRLSFATVPLAAAISLVFVGMFGGTRGMVYTGELDSVIVQSSAVVVVAVWSTIVAAIATVPAVVARRMRAARASEQGSGEQIRWAIPDSN